MSFFKQFHRHFIPILLGALGACSGGGGASVIPPVVPAALPPFAEQLQEIVDAGVASGLPAVSIVVEHAGTTYKAVAGHTDAAETQLVTADDLFPGASSGKPFVAATVLSLRDSGLLNLDDPISLWLPEGMLAPLPNTSELTIRMLLGHTSGLPDYLQQLAYLTAYANQPGKRWSAEETLAYIANLEANFQPGEEFAYSNTNYLLIGLIIERAAQMSLAEALRRWVLEPAALMRTYHAQEELGQGNLVEGYFDASAHDYWPGDDIVATLAWVDVHGFGDAPVHTTSTDLNAFIRALVDGLLLPSDASLTEMLTESISGSGYGLGVFVTLTNLQELAYSHSGGHFGYATQMIYVPERDVSYAITISASDGRFFPLTLDLYSAHDNAVEALSN